MENFKSLLEYFISHLEWINNKDTNHIGYNQYIAPLLAENKFKVSGQGYNGHYIQGQISQWSNYDDYEVCINVSTPYHSTACYLNWQGTWCNIRPQWLNDHIIGVYLSSEEKASAKSTLSFTIEELGLFDNTKNISKNLIYFFNSFKYMITSNIKLDIISPYLNLLENNYNLVLTGAPGTGKTYLAKEIAKLIGDYNPGFVQFHPSYDYTDFVEGLRPTPPDNSGNIGFKRLDGVFKYFCKRAIDNPNDKHVFIIDEINRGELSKIFGELFFSIDPGYRADINRIKVQTQYQNLIESGDVFEDGFFVPSNVYIIGTMNDIDRSVENMDFAVRRRFVWKEVTAEESAINMRISDDVKAKMKVLNDLISSDEIGLSNAYHIGASYFLSATVDDMQSLWDYKLKSLLSEYLRGDEELKEKMQILADSLGVKDE